MQFGGESAAFRSRVAAQDTVFSNCVGGPVKLPAEAPAGTPELIRGDRQYQTVAAYFSAGSYPEALARFLRITQEDASPWRTISRYLVLRTLLRMQADGVQSEAESVLADAKLEAIHGMTWNLLRRAGILTRDQAYFPELGRLVSSKGQGDGFREELWSYAGMYDHVIGQADPNTAYKPAHPPAADASLFRDPDVTDCVFRFQSRGVEFGYCVERWRATRSVAWLIAALEQANAAGARRAGLYEAAAGVPAASPGYLTVRFHLLRLLEEGGNREQAREGLDAVLGSGALQGLPSRVNLFRRLRMLVAVDFRDFLQFAIRRPVLVTLQIDADEAPDFLMDLKPAAGTAELFDSDATQVLNRETPYRYLKQAAVGGELPAVLEREALMTAFTRGLMLGEDLTAIARKMGKMEPGLRALTGAYLQANDREGKRFAAGFLLLHRPEARPYYATGIVRQAPAGKMDPYRVNWWCPMSVEGALDSRANWEWGADLSVPGPVAAGKRFSTRARRRITWVGLCSSMRRRVAMMRECRRRFTGW